MTAIDLDPVQSVAENRVEEGKGVTQTIATIGTGTIGAPMARNLLAAGFAARVWNRTRSKAEALAEARVHASLKAR